VGRILEYVDREWLVVFIVASTFVSMLLFLPLAIRVDREARIARAPAGHAEDAV